MPAAIFNENHNVTVGQSTTNSLTLTIVSGYLALISVWYDSGGLSVTTPAGLTLLSNGIGRANFSRVLQPGDTGSWSWTFGALCRNAVVGWVVQGAVSLEADNITVADAGGEADPSVTSTSNGDLIIGAGGAVDVGAGANTAFVTGAGYTNWFNQQGSVGGSIGEYKTQATAGAVTTGITGGISTGGAGSFEGKSIFAIKGVPIVLKTAAWDLPPRAPMHGRVEPRILTSGWTPQPPAGGGGPPLFYNVNMQPGYFPLRTLTTIAVQASRPGWQPSGQAPPPPTWAEGDWPFGGPNGPAEVWAETDWPSSPASAWAETDFPANGGGWTETDFPF
jgi:hypothetical protein